METNEEITLMCAMRYALGRRTYVTGAVSDEIIKKWNEFSNNKKNLIKQEIQNAIKDNQAGDDIDVDCWKRILDLKNE